MTFSSDDYNKHHNGNHYSQCTFGTLIGNWTEETEVRACTGEGRSIPQRHIKRSGLLKDFTRQIDQSRMKKGDNTFERCYGAMDCKDRVRPTNQLYGNGQRFADEDPFEENPILYAFSDQVPIRSKLATAEMNEIVAKAAAEEEAQIAALKEVRHFEKCSDEFSFRPGKKAEHCRTFATKTLFTGPQGDVLADKGNTGVQADLGANYAVQTGITHGTQQAGKTGVYTEGVSGKEGHFIFSKNAVVSTPVELYMGSNHKTVDIIAQDASANSNVPSSVTSAHFAHLTAKVPQLSDQKAEIKRAITEFSFDKSLQGAVNHNMTKFRATIVQNSTDDDFISVSDVKEAFKWVGAEIIDIVFEPWMDRICSLKKGYVHVTTLFESLRSVDTFVSDDAMQAWAHLETHAAGGQLSVDQVLAVFAEDEQQPAKIALAAVGATESVSRKEFLNFLADMLSLNDAAVVKAASSGIQWA